VKKRHSIFNTSYAFSVGPDSSGGIATSYGLDGPGIEHRWGARFFAPVQPPIQWVPSLFPGGENSRGVALTTHLPPSAEVKERVELYFYSPSGCSWPLLGRTLPLPLLMHFLPRDTLKIWDTTHAVKVKAFLILYYNR
jgi:hypothetical protein